MPVLVFNIQAINIDNTHLTLKKGMDGDFSESTTSTQ